MGVIWHQPIKWPPDDLGVLGETIFTELVGRLAHIPYVVGFGTALGIHRDNSLIPTDTDLDVCILPQQEQAVRFALQDWPLAGTKLESGMVRQLIWYPRNVIVDVMVWHPTGAGYVYDKYWMPPHTFNVDVRETVYGQVPLPADVEPLLVSLYGDWKTPRHRAKP